MSGATASSGILQFTELALDPGPHGCYRRVPRRVSIPVDKIVAVSDYGDKTELALVDGSRVQVEEKYEDVVDLTTVRGWDGDGWNFVKVAPF